METRNFHYAMVLLAVSLAGCVSLPAVAEQDQQCDSSTPETTPLSRFRIDEAVGTVFDTQTNLTWKRCAEGQTYRSGQCEGVALKWKLNEAVAKFGVEGGGWRLPNIDELTSIVEKRCQTPSVNLQVFRNSPPDWFWSGSPYAGGSGYAWHVNFDYGSANGYFRYDFFSVRLVRGVQWFDPVGILQKERREAEARLTKETEEARQKALKQRQEDDELKALIVELMQAEKDAMVFCPDKVACDKAFSLTQIYLNQTADMKIQVATDTIVETYNPTEDGKLGLKVIRIPGKGSSAAISLTANCKDEKGTYAKVCRLGKIQAYRGFRPFVERMLKN
jgi:hypothetical protein